MTRLVACLLLLGWEAHAAPFRDPTQPPLSSAGADAAAQGGARVESILIAPDRRLAVVNGEQVTLGSKVAGGEVVRITPTEVVVRGPEGEQVLRLFPEMRSSGATRSRKEKTP